MGIESPFHPPSHPRSPTPPLKDSGVLGLGICRGLFRNLFSGFLVSCFSFFEARGGKGRDGNGNGELESWEATPLHIPRLVFFFGFSDFRQKGGGRCVSVLENSEGGDRNPPFSSAFPPSFSKPPRLLKIRGF